MSPSGESPDLKFTALTAFSLCNSIGRASVLSSIAKNSFFARKYSVAAYVLCCILAIVQGDSALAQSRAELANMCDQAYAIKADTIPAGWQLTLEQQLDRNGFRAVAFADKDMNVVIAYGGTNDPKDVLADLGIGIQEINTVSEELLKDLAPTFGLPVDKNRNAARVRGIPGTEKTQKQIASAESFYQDVLRAPQFAGKRFKTITITGHSLGGYLAQVIGSRHGHVTHTFNAPGASSVVNASGEKINNYVRKHDLVGAFGKHLGMVSTYSDVNFPQLDFILANHKIYPFFQDLAKGLKPIN